MVSLRLSRLPVAALLLSCLACTEALRPPVPGVPHALPPTPPANGIAVYLTLSNDAPKPGEQVLVTVRALRGTGATGVGSFNLAVRYDAARMTLIERAVAPEGVVAFNPTPGRLVAAGVSTTGFATGELFHFALTVSEADALRSLAVDVTEIVGTGFADHRSNLLVARDLVLDLVNSLRGAP